jgi:ATP-binding cassette subfamily F protein uup
VLMVSHDRAFLNNVVTSTLVFEDDGLREYVGGFDDWQRQSQERVTLTGPLGELQRNKAGGRAKQGKIEQPKKLSYKEKLEFEKLPSTIERLENQIAMIHSQMGSPNFYQKPGPEISEVQTSLKSIETELSSAYLRWESLDQIASS